LIYNYFTLILKEDGEIYKKSLNLFLKKDGNKTILKRILE